MTSPNTVLLALSIQCMSSAMMISGATWLPRVSSDRAWLTSTRRMVSASNVPRLP